MASGDMTADKDKESRGPEASPTSPSLQLLLWSTFALVIAILLAEGDGVPAGSPGEEAEAARLAQLPEVSPFRGDGPFRVHNTTHGAIPIYAHTLEGWLTYLAGALMPLVVLLLSFCVFGRDAVRHLQMFELVQTVGMISGGAFSSYPRFPVPTPYHGTGSRTAALTRTFLGAPSNPLLGPILLALLLGKFKRTRFLVDLIGIFYALLDMWPSLVGDFHVNERPTHNLRLLVLCLGSDASRLRAWAAIMGMFYIGTGGPKLLPSFYRYWLWFGIYPSSTLADFPTELWWTRGPDGGWHPNLLAQAFGFMGGAMEVAFAVLILFPSASTRRLRLLLPTAIHLGIIFGRFDNGLSGWNSFWLLEDLAHGLAVQSTAAWSQLSPLAATVVAAQGTLELLFFLGHGSYHSGMSHHTGNFRMQWLLVRENTSWAHLEAALEARGHGQACQHGPLHGFPTCVHSWGHGTHYPTASFGAFLYGLNGGTFLQEVLPPAVAEEEEGFGRNLESLGERAGWAFGRYVEERRLRQEHHREYVQQVEALVGGFRFSGTKSAGQPRAIYLGFASGASVWDDSFYEPAAADAVRGYAAWKPGEVLFVEVDRQRPWRRVRRVRIWDLSQELPETPRSLLDRLLGSSPRGHLLEDRRILVRRPFPFT